MSRPTSDRPKSVLMLAPETALLLYGEQGLAAIREKSELIKTIDDPGSLVEHPALLAGAEVLFTGWGCTRIDERVLAAAPGLRAVFFAGGTIRSWISDAVWERGIVVVGAYTANAIPVAEYSLATILFSLKRGWHYIAKQKGTGEYPSPHVPAPGAFRSTVGLIGLGMIGRMVRERLRPFDIEVLAYDPFLTAADATALGVTSVGLEDLFKRSDVVSLHAPLLPKTEGMITGAMIGSMRDGSTFINTSRGKVVREAEMAEALLARPGVTALLDVLAEEPPAPDNPLLGLPNVFVTPHIAGSLGKECQRMGGLVLAEYDRWLRSEPLKFRITRELAATLA